MTPRPNFTPIAVYGRTTVEIHWSMHVSGSVTSQFIQTQAVKSTDWVTVNRASSPTGVRLSGYYNCDRGVATGVYIGIYTPSKQSAQVNFLCGKNDVITAIQQFYTPQKNFYIPYPPPKKKKILATPLYYDSTSIRLVKVGIMAVG